MEPSYMILAYTWNQLDDGDVSTAWYNNNSIGSVPIGIISYIRTWTLFVIERFAPKHKYIFAHCQRAHTSVGTHRFRLYDLLRCLGEFVALAFCGSRFPLYLYGITFCHRVSSQLFFPLGSIAHKQRRERVRATKRKESEIVAGLREKGENRKFMGCGSMWCSRINIVKHFAVRFAF